MIVAVFFDEPGIYSYPFDNPVYLKSYTNFSKVAAAYGIDLRFVRGKESFIGGKTFASWYAFHNNSLQFFPREFNAQKIYMKGHTFEAKASIPILNDLVFSKICQDKVVTYNLFREYMVPTFPFFPTDYHEILSLIPSDKIVCKPVFGAEGKGIVVQSKTRFNPALLLPDTAYFLQQFIDTSGGIPGLVKGMHDLRLILFNGKVRQSFIRRPKKGSYLANVAQGGSLTYIDVEKLPKAALDFASVLDAHFTQFTPRVYTIDMVFDHGTIYLMELNDQPGLPYVGKYASETDAALFYHELAKILADPA